MTFKNQENAWQPDEVAALCQHYPGGGVDAVMRAGVKRTEKSIMSKAANLGVKLSPEARKRFAIAGRAKRLPVVVEKPTLPDEYIQAADIFQVGYRYFKQFGWGGQHVTA